MATELLAVPEEKLPEVIRVIRAGLKKEKVSRDTRKNLLTWCKMQEEYINR